MGNNRISMSEPRRCPHCGEVMSGKCRCPCRSVEIIGPRVDTAVMDEATRLHDKLGYPWEAAYDAAEIIIALNETGLFLAMPSEELTPEGRKP
jgi:hypothetical protein